MTSIFTDETEKKNRPDCGVANPTVIKPLTLIPHNPQEKEMCKPDLSIKPTLPSVILALS